ncbi:hypothetical protein NL676_003302 [Syzygium grande]|nr:hypothetical protein NL676_003302 [Syzygium grande]
MLSSGLLITTLSRRLLIMLASSLFISSPPVAYIPTPVGRLSRSQLSQDQVRVYLNEESNRRRNLLQKYIRLCADAKVTVDSMLIEHGNIAKAILDLIPVVNITKLVIGTKRAPYSRRLTKKLAKGEFVKKHAPDYCEVTVVYDGQKVSDNESARELNHPNEVSSSSGKEVARHSERNFFECMCFSACRTKIEEIQACIRPRKDCRKSTAKHKQHHDDQQSK